MRRRLFTRLMAAVCAACGDSQQDTQAEPEALAADEGTGTEVDTPDPGPDIDPCIDGDDCPEAASVAADGALHPEMLGYNRGLHLLVVAYAPMHKSPSAASALVTSIAGGVP